MNKTMMIMMKQHIVRLSIQSADSLNNDLQIKEYKAVQLFRK